jgi:hypothetical protein
MLDVPPARLRSRATSALTAAKAVVGPTPSTHHLFWREPVGLILTVTAGLVVWIVLWALGSKGFDAFMLAAAIILVGASLKILSGYLPGRRS